MKTTIFALIAAASLATAQILTGEPDCAVPCLQSAIAASGCQPTDQGCQCSSAGQKAIQAAGVQCLVAACNLTELTIAQSVGAALCSSYSAALASAGSTGSGSASTTTTATTTVATSSGPSSSASSSSTGTGTSRTSTSTVTAVTTSVAQTSSGSSSSKTSTSSKSSSASAASTSSSSAASAGAAAPTLVAGIGGMVGIVAGLVAAL